MFIQAAEVMVFLTGADSSDKVLGFKPPHGISTNLLSRPLYQN
jgi:hypothetical protein